MKRLFSILTLIVVISSSNIYASNSLSKEEHEKSRKAIEIILKSEKKISIENAMKLAEIKVSKEPSYTEKLIELSKIEKSNIEKYGEPERKVDEKGVVYYKYPKGEPSDNVIQKIIDLEKNLEDSIKNAKNNAKSLYFNIIDAKQMIDISRGNLDIAIDELEKTKQQYDLGTVIQANIILKEANAASAKANYESAKGKLTNLYLGFDLATNISKDFEVTVDSLAFDISSLLTTTSETIVGVYLLPSNLDNDTMNAYKTIADLKKELIDKEEALKIAAKGNVEDSIFYYNVSEELGIKALRDKLSDAERDMTIDFSDDSQKIKNSIDSFQNIQATLVLSEKKYNQAVIKYSNGQMKKDDFLKANLSYEESQLSYNTSLKNLYILVDNYNEKYNLEKGE